MKFYADTANLNEVKELNGMGVISGVTTNPSLISNEPKAKFEDLIFPLVKYCHENKLSLSVEVFSLLFDDMLNEAKTLSNKLKDYEDILKIKIPVTLDGINVISKLNDIGIKTNATACYTEQQMMMAAQAGASYVSLFYCRLQEDGGNCQKVLFRTREFLEKNNLDTKIICGSIRTQADVSNAFNYGAHIVTTNISVYKHMLMHPKTQKAIDQFFEDYTKWMS
ncbi:hypothetical protein N8835_03180 [Alphaproteobacteria bacterium]|nr:hypothetical protein [Alphaproteobacteria bacterium]